MIWHAPSFFPSGRVEEADWIGVLRGGQPLAVRRKDGVTGLKVVILERGYLTAGLHVPERDRAVVAARGQLETVVGKCYFMQDSPVPRQAVQFLARARFIDVDRDIV